MKQKLFIFTLCCMSYLFFCACEETYCPAFPDHLIDYYPYKVGDVLKFENQNNDTISFYVNGVKATTQHFVYQRWFSKCCSCEGPRLVFSAGDGVYDGALTGLIAIYSSTRSQWHIRMELFGDYAIAYADQDKEDPFNPKDSLLFGKIVTLKPHSHNLRTISYATIVKGEGIVEFFDTKTNYLWKKIN